MDVTSSLRSLLPYGRRSIGINQLIAKLETYLPPDQVELVQEAYDFAFHAHDGQRRRSGEPYITHPVAVADLLADLKLDAQTMMAAILHDVMEDTPNTKDEITSRFGSDVSLPSRSIAPSAAPSASASCRSSVGMVPYWSSPALARSPERWS